MGMFRARVMIRVVFSVRVRVLVILTLTLTTLILHASDVIITHTLITGYPNHVH